MLALRPGSTHPKLLKQGIRLLREALSTLGSGGKTAVGYGLFSEADEVKRKREISEENQKLKDEQLRAEELNQAKIDEACRHLGYTGLAKDIYEAADFNNWKDKGSSENFYREMNEKYLELIENEVDTQIKHDAIKIVYDIMEARDKGIMQNPECTKGKKNEYVYKTQPRSIAIRLLKIIV